MEVDGAGLEVPPVQLGVGAALLDDEHLDAQPQQPVQVAARREIGRPCTRCTVLSTAANLNLERCATTT